MDVEQLREFLVIARLGSFSLAAEELCISQSSLSKHLKALEEELGVTLFDRTSRSVRVSDIGQAMLPHVNTLLAAEERIQGLCADKRRILRGSSGKGSIRIACVPVMAAYGLTDLIASFQARYPEADIHLAEYEPKLIPPLLASGKCDLAFLRESPTLQNRQDTLVLHTENVVAVLPDSHPLARDPVIPLRALRNEKLIFLAPSAVLFRICMDLCVSAGFMPNIVFTGTRPENIVDLVSRGMGVSLLSESFYRYYPKKGTVSREITPTAVTRMVLAHPKAIPLRKSAEAFWRYASEYRCVT